MVYGIVKQLNGYIWVYSEPGKGTTFKIYFPKVEEELKEPLKGEAQVKKGSRKIHILVVEDEDSLRKFIEDVCEVFGHQVTSVQSPPEAILLVEEKGLKPDLLLTDVVMPHMNGKELADRLKKSIPGLKVLFMSGYTDNAIVHHGVLDPDIPFIQKPFGVKEIIEKIEEVFES